MAHSDLPLEEPSSCTIRTRPVDIGGWFLSDSANNCANTESRMHHHFSRRLCVFYEQSFLLENETGFFVEFCSRRRGLAYRGDWMVHRHVLRTRLTSDRRPTVCRSVVFRMAPDRLLRW
ncbi:MAG: hypothetical protein CM1200mP29_01210 [Verrucomicrobiota bacterium]|nr:MAG: hypothetical protein CM1200mP29_01210 [Verrucomicrobiota bacterium]